MKFSRLILANLFRKKARLVLTIGSFAVALFLFALLGVVNDAFSRGADVVSANRLVTINRTSIINTIPLSYRDEILRIPGVKYVTHDNWFGGVYQDPKNFFPAVRDRPGKPAAGFPGTHRSRRSVEHLPERSPGRDCRRGHHEALRLEDRRSHSHHDNHLWARG